ncbi:MULTISPECIES: DUF2273 domain-containing protein [Enterococcus]|uniref:Small integral membrane protein n=1 Tax=Enterococcus malodoratus ATCC 43197 TaxID=1158601 RepID=R2QQF2_9ENTE|nr:MULTISPECIES: DUF2273 domain-containing protein [Enterococcus]EOH73880.1 hypothetical protein UAI_03556 [Enterococcus malodoratus ATCC 43197]EOT67218.1 hypothetical protein I585_02739 [Enterococcus malodoratus ATCC 43197]OJG59400.1 hypothetical protein RV07_GL002654 [Enterococcus malodoratus]SPW90904.1 stress response protein [Enterococcus malodoratus]STD69530.1 stress response protein [Enterococcus malodoratus]
MKDIFKHYKLPIIFGVVGLILAILLVSIGFFKTLLIVLLTGLGTALGYYLEQTNLLDDFFSRRNN